MNRKPDGRAQLNRLSKDRQAAVADYAARHTLPETLEWLKNPGWPPEPGDTPAPPGHPQGTAVSRWALARWLPAYRLRQECVQTGHSVAALVRELRSANPAWTPGEVHQAAQTFFEGLALQRQEVSLWALTQRLDLRRAQLELDTAKHHESRRAQLKKGREPEAEAFRDDPKAHKLCGPTRPPVVTPTPQTPGKMGLRAQKPRKCAEKCGKK